MIVLVLREKTCGGLSYLGLQLDPAKNNANPVDENIAAENSHPKLKKECDTSRKGESRFAPTQKLSVANIN